MLQTSARSIFCRFFFMKNKKFGPRKKDVVFIFFKLRVTKFQLRPDAIPSSRVFRHAALIDVIKLLTTIKMKQLLRKPTREDPRNRSRRPDVTDKLGKMEPIFSVLSIKDPNSYINKITSKQSKRACNITSYYNHNIKNNTSLQKLF